MKRTFNCDSQGHCEMEMKKKNCECNLLLIKL